MEAILRRIPFLYDSSYRSDACIRFRFANAAETEFEAPQRRATCPLYTAVVILTISYCEECVYETVCEVALVSS